MKKEPQRSDGRGFKKIHRDDRPYQKKKRIVVQEGVREQVIMKIDIKDSLLFKRENYDCSPSRRLSPTEVLPFSSRAGEDEDATDVGVS